ncbi:zinc finger BED domain-containing protein RICESLEEPER 2-like [Arachis ipaensis]|uniref:zinc finger BED domain-containing protein RICESLEEPER 2-like n=1 Tax=Arachis ipaensis TaxID=130454 RepID=UPI000A2B21B5|nr:zinc finger BED domain-containing protein RICESLEEPER 2-like [Arachis ipaensis]
MGSLKIDSGVARDMFASYVVAGDKPFNMVDDRRFRNWVKYISLTLKLPTKNTVKSDIVKVHKREAAKLKKILVSIPNIICLTSNLWTSSTNEGWNSLYAMLASAIPYKKVFEMYKHILMNSLKNDEVLIKNMGEQMMIKFKKYWEEYSVILAFGTVLDPRFKLNTLTHCYNEIDPISAKDKVEHVKNKLYKIFEVYDHNSSTTVESSSQISSNVSQATSSAIGTQLIKIVGNLMSHNQEVKVKSGKNQLDIYLSEATLFRKDTIIDILQW